VSSYFIRPWVEYMSYIVEGRISQDLLDPRIVMSEIEKRSVIKSVIRKTKLELRICSFPYASYTGTIYFTEQSLLTVQGCGICTVPAYCRCFEFASASPFSNKLDSLYKTYLENFQENIFVISIYFKHGSAENNILVFLPEIAAKMSCCNKTGFRAWQRGVSWPPLLPRSRWPPERGSEEN
jgi:hypothetical protein